MLRRYFGVDFVSDHENSEPAQNLICKVPWKNLRDFICIVKMFRKFSKTSCFAPGTMLYTKAVRR